MKRDQLTALAVRMKKGDRKAAEKIYCDLNVKTYGFFFTRTGARKDVAEDLTQDIFMRLVQKINSFDEAKGMFVVWFWRIARNMLVDHYRLKKEASFSSYEDEVLETMVIAPKPDFDAILKRSRVEQILETMTEEERELFTLRYVSDLPYREISKILNKPEGGLRVAAWRIKEKIKEQEIWEQWNLELSEQHADKKSAGVSRRLW
jgi:RNA polymerase sigma factor (sigma-70 family)